MSGSDFKQIFNQHCNQTDALALDHTTLQQHQRRTLLVILLTSLMMAAEVVGGYLTGSMALLADGWHMASHAGALIITYLAYVLAQSKKLQGALSFGTGKILPLGGYSTALILGLIALEMAYQTIERLFHPVEINFNEALWIAVIGLVVNLLSYFILSKNDTVHSHDHDHNHSSAIAHVLADALTSIAAIFALLAGKYFGWSSIDPLIGLAGSILILVWAYRLCKNAAWELLDAQAQSVDLARLRTVLEKTGARVLDLHVWKVGPTQLSAQIVLQSPEQQNADFFREQLAMEFKFQHLIIEVK